MKNLWHYFILSHMWLFLCVCLCVLFASFFIVFCSHYSAYKCNPVCDGCYYGECIAPNLCECSDGYQWDSNEYKCIPICRMNCTNGKCMAPNECTCYKNYYFNETLNSCEPNCQSGCTFGICTAPNECTCIVDYRLKDGSSTECEPICQPNCKNGKCFSPNMCVCDKGFRRNAFNECEPECKLRCENTNRIGPNKCECIDGYQLRNESLNESVPICSPKCDQNSYCIEANRCNTCNYSNEEWQSTKNLTNICCPICKSTKDCTNGTCLSNGTCNCFERLRLNQEHNYSTFNWWVQRISYFDQTNPIWKIKLSNYRITFVMCSIVFLGTALFVFIGIWLYRNRKVNYNMGKVENCEYFNKSDEIAHIKSFVQSKMM